MGRVAPGAGGRRGRDVADGRPRPSAERLQHLAGCGCGGSRHAGWRITTRRRLVSNATTEPSAGAGRARRAWRRAWRRWRRAWRRAWRRWRRAWRRRRRAWRRSLAAGHPEHLVLHVTTLRSVGVDRELDVEALVRMGLDTVEVERVLDRCV